MDEIGEEALLADFQAEDDEGEVTLVPQDDDTSEDYGIAKLFNTVVPEPNEIDPFNLRVLDHYVQIFERMDVDSLLRLTEVTTDFEIIKKYKCNKLNIFRPRNSSTGSLASTVQR